MRWGRDVPAPLVLTSAFPVRRSRRQRFGRVQQSCPTPPCPRSLWRSRFGSVPPQQPSSSRRRLFLLPFWPPMLMRAQIASTPMIVMGNSPQRAKCPAKSLLASRWRRFGRLAMITTSLTGVAGPCERAEDQDPGLDRRSLALRDRAEGRRACPKVNVTSTNCNLGRGREKSRRGW